MHSAGVSCMYYTDKQIPDKMLDLPQNVQDWPQKRDKSRPFSDQIPVHFGSASQNVRKSDLKLWGQLTHFEAEYGIHELEYYLHCAEYQQRRSKKYRKI